MAAPVGFDSPGPPRPSPGQPEVKPPGERSGSSRSRRKETRADRGVVYQPGATPQDRCKPRPTHSDSGQSLSSSDALRFAKTASTPIVSEESEVEAAEANGGH
ncbi:unnamed protein product [Arctogadus glacialis]